MNKSFLLKYLKLNSNKQNANTAAGELDSSQDANNDKFLSFAYSENSRAKFNSYYYIVLLLIIALLISTFIIKVEQTMNVSGHIVPDSGIARISHDIGGTISNVKVKNYSKVNKGDLLVSFDKEIYETKLKNYMSKLKVTDSEIIHALAFLKNNIDLVKEKTIIKEIEKYIDNIPNAIAHSMQLTETSKLISDHKDLVIKDQILKTQLEIQKLKEEDTMLEKELYYLSEQLSIYRQLLKSKNVSKIKVMDYEIKHIDTLIKKKKLSSDIESKFKLIDELENKRIVQKQDEIKSRYEELITYDKQKIDLQSNIQQLNDTIVKMDVTAPINGIIQGFQLVKGISIQPGQEILTIIPNDSSELIFEAKVSPAQKAKINYSSKSEVQFDGFNALKYNRIKGDIVSISPYVFDKYSQDTQYSKVLVKLKSSRIKSNDIDYRIRLGISGTLYISAERQSLFAYIFEPIYNSFKNVHGQNA